MDLETEAKSTHRQIPIEKIKMKHKPEQGHEILVRYMNEYIKWRWPEDGTYYSV